MHENWRFFSFENSEDGTGPNQGPNAIQPFIISLNYHVLGTFPNQSPSRSRDGGPTHILV